MEKVISASEVKSLLSQGYSRTPKSKNYKGEGKSIKEYYGLTTGQVTELFKDSLLKGIRSKRTVNTIKVVAELDQANSPVSEEISNAEENGQDVANESTQNEPSTQHRIF